jgi:septum formation protein
VESGDTADKAGAYGIQSGAAPLIDHIEGYYDTVVGLPTHQLAELLTQVGIEAKPVNLESPVKQLVA